VGSAVALGIQSVDGGGISVTQGSEIPAMVVSSPMGRRESMWLTEVASRRQVRPRVLGSRLVGDPVSAARPNRNVDAVRAPTVATKSGKRQTRPRAPRSFLARSAMSD
jgi:hypothetical protein